MEIGSCADDSVMNPELEKTMEDFMRRRQLRSTSQRRCLLQSIFSTDEHFTTDQLFERLRKTSCTASRSTVYRTLGLLVEAGLLREIHLGTDLVHYDPNFTGNPDHAHAVCLDCGKVIEFDDSSLVKKTDTLVKELGFVVFSRAIKIEGLCCDCVKVRRESACACGKAEADCDCEE